MNIPVEKNKEYVVDIIDNGYQGEGIAKIDDYTLFIPNVIAGERVRILVVKVNSSFGYGKAIQIIEKSPDRVETLCNTYKRCGGCVLQHISYKRQLAIKTKNIKDLFKKELGRDVEICNAIGMKNPLEYRNKAKYALGFNKQGENAYGFFAQRTHEVILPEKCHIQNNIIDKIAKYCFELINKYNLKIYNEDTKKGMFRHIVIKYGIKTDEVMVIFVTTDAKFPRKDQIVNDLTSRYKNIKTIVQNINSKATNAILGVKNINLYGNGYIKDVLGRCTFKISPLSFYQVNPVQTEVLYNKAMEFAGLTGKETVYDLYCGIGTISLFVSEKAKKVYGIEIVPQAIEDAKENARINNIHNVEFFAGEVEKILPKMYQKGKMADVVIVDPPRKGLDETTIKTILSIEPKKIVYVSCNPATLVRDLKMLGKKYSIKQVQPVDMFPQTRTL